MSKKKVAAELKVAEEAAAAEAAAEAAANLPRDRDVVIGEGSADQKANQLLMDIILLNRIIYNLTGQAAPKKESDLDKLAAQLLEFFKNGKSYELAGWKDVPKPFMKSKGRFMTKSGDSFKEMKDKDAKKALREILFAEFEQELPMTLTETPYKEFKQALSQKTTGEDAIIPDTKDVILLPTDGPPTEKGFEQQNGNRAMFNFGSTLVTSFTNTSDKRVESALGILHELDGVEIAIDETNRDKPFSKNSRFVVRRANADESVTWEQLGASEAAMFTLTFVFEVFLEKEIHSTPLAMEVVDGGKGSEPINEPTEYDVLFGRGGMTNSHQGNKRFRDIIALHRPDYIRAIKMDKPAVARKIVKAIRQGTPPGRFLKKAEDGKWYDVGDRTAAEKTSQGLRERSNAEKRQRSALREALRIRKQDMKEGDEGETPASKKMKLAVAEEAVAVATLNYTGTNLAVPLSLGMKADGPYSKLVSGGKKKKEGTYSDLVTDGLPPNAVDANGDILVTNHDILCGRGGLTNHHRGNKRFRDIVALHRPDYVRAPKIQKPSVARVIVRAIRNGDPPGRFLRKDEKTGKWYDIGDKKAAEKTSQALREKTSEERDKLKSEPGSVGVLLPNPATYLSVTAAVVPGASAEVEIKTDAPATDEKKEKSEKKEDKSKKTKAKDDKDGEVEEAKTAVV